MPRISTRLTKRFNLQHPIMSAPMAITAGGELAGAVSAAGGLGIIGGGYGDSAWLTQQFEKAGNQPVGCGFITWSLAKNPSLLGEALARKPSALFLSFGDPKPFAAEIRVAGVPLICQVQTLDDARIALDAGAEVIVAQGTEAGGHGGSRATLTLVPEVADLVAKQSPQTIVCAAGGIADGRGLAAALMLGAEGVLMGSRFWASTEAVVHSRLKETGIGTSGDDTIRSSVMDIARKLDWPPRFTLRTARNEFTASWHGNETALRADSDAQGAHYREAVAQGDPKTAATIIGEAAGLIHDIQPAKDIVQRVVAEAVALLEKANSRLV